MKEDNTKLNILIVDDTLKNIQVLGTFLRKEGYRITVAQNGLEALDVVKSNPPNLILLDVMMPELDGFETIKRLKASAETKEIPVIFLTAKVEIEDIIKGFELGAVDYITKPLQLAEVLVRVKTHLTLYSLQRELQQVNDMLEQRVAERTAELAQINAQLQEEIKERKEAQQNLQQLNEALERFVPHQFLKLLNKESILDVELGDNTEMTISILFSDIRAFTNLSEQMTPSDVLSFLNSYLQRMNVSLQKYHGFVDKFIGDAVMALFDRPGATDEVKAMDAVKTAIGMQKAIVTYNGHRDNVGYRPITIGIGVHTGNVIMGTVGTEDRMDSTVLGDIVNVASRIESLTKWYGADILISDSTLRLLDEPRDFQHRELDWVRVKGKTEPIGIYEIYENSPPEVQSLKQKSGRSIQRALAHRRRQDWDKALATLEKAVSLFPEDKAVQLHIQRCQQLQAMELPDDWDGAIDLDQK